MGLFEEKIKEYRETYLTENETIRHHDKMFEKGQNAAHEGKSLDDALKGVPFGSTDKVKAGYNAAKEEMKEESGGLNEQLNGVGQEEDEEESSDPQTAQKQKKIKELDKKITDEELKDKEEELKNLKTN
jgi:hypothetical protein